MTKRYYVENAESSITIVLVLTIWDRNDSLPRISDGHVIRNNITKLGIINFGFQ